MDYMKLIYFLLLLTNFAFTQEKKLCSLEKIWLDEAEIVDLNTLFTHVLDTPHKSVNKNLLDEIAALHNQVQTMPHYHASIFTTNIRRKSNAIFTSICENSQEFENSYYQATSDNTNENWYRFEKIFYATVVEQLMYKNVSPIGKPTPSSFLKHHLIDENLKVHPTGWVVPGLIVMMYGRKMKRVLSEAPCTNILNETIN